MTMGIASGDMTLRAIPGINRGPARGACGAEIVSTLSRQLAWSRCPPFPTQRATMDDLASEWLHKGATLSDKTAAREFGLTRAEIIAAIRAGRLQYREGSAHGNPYLRLLRREVEALVRAKRGNDGLQAQKASAELVRIEREIASLKRKLAALEKQRAALASGRTK